MLKYGTDKPDLRNPLDHRRRVRRSSPRDDVTFNAFKNVIKSGGVVRAIPATGRRRAAALVLRQAQRLGAHRGRAGPRLHRVRGRGRHSSPARARSPSSSRTSVQAAIAREGRHEGRRRGVLLRRHRGQGRVARRQGAHPHRRRAEPHRQGPVRVLLDRRLPAYTSGTRTRRRSTSRTTRSRWPNFDHDAFMALDPSDKDTILKHQGVPVRHRLQRLSRWPRARSATTAPTGW